MQEVKLTREKNGALGKEWSQKREGRREGEWGRREVRLTYNIYMYENFKKNEIKNPRRKRKWGSLILFNLFQFIY